MQYKNYNRKYNNQKKNKFFGNLKEYLNYGLGGKDICNTIKKYKKKNKMIDAIIINFEPLSRKINKKNISKKTKQIWYLNNKKVNNNIRNVPNLKNKKNSKAI